MKKHIFLLLACTLLTSCAGKIEVVKPTNDPAGFKQYVLNNPEDGVFTKHNAEVNYDKVIRTLSDMLRFCFPLGTGKGKASYEGEIVEKGEGRSALIIKLDGKIVLVSEISVGTDLKAVIDFFVFGDEAMVDYIDVIISWIDMKTNECTESKKA